MSVRLTRRLVVGYFVLFTVAVTWPGMVPFNTIRPLVLGLPFSMVWVALWVIGGAGVLAMLYAAERREGESRGARGRDPFDGGEGG